MHDFDGVPRDLDARVPRRMRATGAEVVKLAVMAAAAHRLPAAARASAARRAARPSLIAMGEPASPTRVLAARFGSCWTYAGDGVAPGPDPRRALRDEFRFRRHRRRHCALRRRRPAGGALLSPAMHNAAFRAAGIDAVYLPLRPPTSTTSSTFADALRICRRERHRAVQGRRVRAARANPTPMSRRTQSVNTLAARRRLGGAEHRRRWLSRAAAGRMPLRRARHDPGRGGAARAVAEALARRRGAQ